MPPKRQRKNTRKGRGKGAGGDDGSESGGDDAAAGAGGGAFAPPARDAGVPDEMSKMAAQKFKDEGNADFAAAKWLDALGKFTRAIEMDPTDHVFFSNRSATNLKLLRTRDAVSDAMECVRIKSSWPKGYSRLGAALLADMQPTEAQAAYQQGLKLEPAGAALLEGLKAANEAVEEEKKRVAEEEKQKEEAAAPPTAPAPEDSVVIGIDLGTTFSCVAVWRNNAVEILEDESGSRTTPSFVAFTEDGARLVGEAAKSQAAKNPRNTLYDMKRILGQKMFEPSVKEEVKRFPFKVQADPDTDDPRILVEALQGKLMPPEQISGLVLAHMKRIAEARLGHPVKKAVVTVPAYFNDAQRTATKSAGTIAGLDVLRIINEPTAAALAYGLDKKEGGEGTTEGANVLIYDLGGGTFDVSVLRIEEGMFQVKATGGDTHLGGEDFDNTVVEHFVAVLKNKGTDLKGDEKLMRKLRTAVERAKRTLSSGLNATVEFEDHCLELSRDKFEALNKATFDRTFDTVKKVLKDAKLEAKDIDDVVLIGGSTRIPKIQEALSQAFGGRQLCRSINPDEAVAYGAAVQGAILSGVRNAACDALVLLDVTPLSLGIELKGKRFSVLIPRNSSIPCKKSDTFTTTEDYQTSIEVCVYEGERPCTDGNRLLGEFTIHNIERAKHGEAQLEVTFALDANGILDVSAMDKKTRARAECRIQGACKGLDAATLAKMAGEAEQYAEEDEEYRKQAEMRQELEDLAYDLQDRSDAAAKKKAEDALDFLETLGSLGKPPVRRSLEKWLKELRAV